MERYGINLSRTLHDEWVRRIQSGNFNLARPLEKQSIRLTVFQLEHEGEAVRVVYDKNRKQIVTVLPKDDKRWGGPVRVNEAQMTPERMGPVAHPLPTRNTEVTP